MLFSSLLIAALAVSASAGPIRKRQATKFGSTPVKGVNIGGWLVLEPWITPSIFQQFSDGSVVDEWTLCQTPNAQSILEAHWSSWTGLADFQKIAGAGFNTVRIPIGYWAFKKYPGDPYVMGAQAYLDKAIGWARTVNLQVVIDLHGAQRSQNGFDNSGHRLAKPGWTTGDSVAATEEVMGMLAAKYASSQYSDVVIAIELLNEPLMSALAGGKGATQSYYQNGFNTVRRVSITSVAIHDGFIKPSAWNGFLTGRGSAGAVVDHHEYQVFSNADVALSPAQHVSAVCTRAKYWATGQDKFLVVGEWTAAMTDCAPALNAIGARYDGTYPGSTYVGSCATKSNINLWTAQMKSATTAYITAQLDVFEQLTQGWIFWNFKTESAAEWDLFRLLDAGVFPKLAGRRSHTICS